MNQTPKQCTVEGCGSAHKVRKGLCVKHYMRLRRHGSVDDPDAPVNRFWRRVQKTDACWIWDTSDASGYGIFWLNDKHVKAHRYSYELHVGPIPKGRHLDHLCRNRACVNPEHLEPVTAKVNILRGVGSPAQNARKTHCIHGHPFEGDNLEIRESGRRRCRTCRLEAQRRYDARKRGEQ